MRPAYTVLTAAGHSILAEHRETRHAAERLFLRRATQYPVVRLGEAKGETLALSLPCRSYIQAAPARRAS